MDGSDWLDRRLQQRRRGRLIGWIVIVGLGFALFLAVAVNALLAGLGVVHDTSEPRGAKTLVIAVVFLALSAVCAAAAVHFEHGLRGHPPGRLTSQLHAAQARTGARWPIPARRRYGPTSMLISGIVFLGLGIAAVVLAFGAHSAASRSSYTQQNGVEDSATVGSVANYQSTGRSQTTYWAMVTATLRTPVNRQRATVVNIPNNVAYRAGQVIPVVVDPADPGYSELPGSPYATDTSTAGLVIGALVFAPVGVASVVSSVRMGARIRRLRGSGPQPVPGVQAGDRA